MWKIYTIYSKEEKPKIVKRYLSGKSPVDLYAEIGLSNRNIRK